VLHDHLTETQRKAYILADNKMALNAGWDEGLLRLELRELGDMGFDLELTGFGLDEAGTMLLGGDGLDAHGDGPKEIDPDSYELGHRCPRCGFEFDDDK